MLACPKMSIFPDKGFVLECAKRTLKKKIPRFYFYCRFKPLKMNYLAPFMQYGYYLYMKENCTGLAWRGGNFNFLSSCALGQLSLPFL